MTIQLNQQQLAILQQAVDEGRFASVEDALEGALLTLQVPDPSDDDEMEWALPLVVEARRDVEKGNVISGEDMRAKLLRLAERSEAK